MCARKIFLLAVVASGARAAATQAATEVGGAEDDDNDSTAAAGRLLRTQQPSARAARPDLVVITRCFSTPYNRPQRPAEVGKHTSCVHAAVVMCSPACMCVCARSLVSPRRRRASVSRAPRAHARTRPPAPPPCALCRRPLPPRRPRATLGCLRPLAALSPPSCRPRAALAPPSPPSSLTCRPHPSPPPPLPPTPFAAAVRKKWDFSMCGASISCIFLS